MAPERDPEPRSPFAPAGDPLALDAETMRALGHRTVDALVDMLCDPATPALRRATPEEMARRVAPEAPPGPRDFDALLGELREQVFPYMSRLDHPGYFAFIPACGTWPGALGDLLASALNIYAGSWMEAAGPSHLELIVLDWFKDWLGYPREAAGVLVSGGSAANMTALACARDSMLGPMTDRVVAYVSDQAHSSVARAARLLGFRSDQVRVLPSDEHQRMRPDALAAAIDADARAGREPLFVLAAAGSTNTGAVDPLAELAELCHERGAWLHVDGAYGAFAALTDRGREALRGIELADSITLDPHKWLYQPFECGALLVRDGRLLRRAFEIVPEYLKDATVGADEVNFSDLGLQLSRSSRALKVWLSVQYFGLDAFRTAVDRCLDLAVACRARRHGSPAARADLARVAGHRLLPPPGAPGRDRGGDRAAQRRADRGLRGDRPGTGLLHPAAGPVRDPPVRHEPHQRRSRRRSRPELVRRGPRALAPSAPAPRRPPPAATAECSWDGSARPRSPPRPWPGSSSSRSSTTSSWPAWRTGRASGTPRPAPRSRGPGTPPATSSSCSKARRTVEQDGRTLRELGPGDFFGEIAALDWGAGYGYARSATVTATEPLRMLALAPSHFNLLMTQAPRFAERIERAMRQRLDNR